MERTSHTEATKPGSGSRLLLSSTIDRMVLEALTSLEKKKFVGMPKLSEIAEEIRALGYKFKTETSISRSLDRLESLGFIERLRGFKVLAQEGDTL